MIFLKLFCCSIEDEAGRKVIGSHSDLEGDSPCLFLVTRQFHESWNKLMEWLDESERNLDSDVEIANEPDKIKMQLTQHKVIQTFRFQNIVFPFVLMHLVYAVIFQIQYLRLVNFESFNYIFLFCYNFSQSGGKISFTQSFFCNS